MTAVAEPTPSADSLGDRMKGYEQATRLTLQARSWTVMRIDGRAFHTWTRGLERPFSVPFVDAMGAVLLGLCEQIPGVVCGYAQSDELTLVISDFTRDVTQPWYAGQTQKIVSVGASLATVLFAAQFPERAPAMFDARVFTVPNRVEVANNLLWRQADARRNAISMLAGSVASAAELHGKSIAARRLMLAAAGIELSGVDPRFLHGQFARTRNVTDYVTYTDKRTDEVRRGDTLVTRARWELAAAGTLDAQGGGLLLADVLPEDPADQPA